MLSAPEISTLTELLLTGYRLDGRSLSEYREISFRFPQSNENDGYGCCIVKMGSTVVMARVSAEVIEPKHFRPSQGMLFVNFDHSLIKSPKDLYWKHNHDDEGRRLSTVLQTLFRDAIDLDALCIVAWERVFAIRIELRALSNDGNLGDCGALAAISALAAFRRPDVFVQEDGTVVVDTEAKHRPRVPLVIRRIPVLITLGLTSNAKVIIQDPTAREEALLTGGRILIGMTRFSEVCCLYTAGLMDPIRSSNLEKCVRIADARAQSLVALVQRVIDGLARQYEANLAAAHERASEAQKSLDACRTAPLVLSSIRFLPSEVNPQLPALEPEEGELLGDELSDLMGSDTDMDVVLSEDEMDKSVKDQTAGLSKQAQHSDLYGVIEVSSLEADAFNTNSTLGGDAADEFELPGMTPVFANPRGNDQVQHRRELISESNPTKSAKKEDSRKRRRRKGKKAIDEEESDVTLVHLS